METVKIRMKSISAGPDGIMHQAVSYPVSEDRAKALVDGGFAEYETAMVAKSVPKTPDNLKQLAAENEKVEDAPKPAGPPKTTTPPIWGK